MIRTRVATLALIALGGIFIGCGGDDAVSIDGPRAPDARPVDAVDDPAPGPVTGLAAVASAAGVDVTWTNPTDGDLAGVLVVVGDAAITFAPVDGTAYAVDQDLGGGVRVLHVDATEATAIAPAVIGAAYHVAAWAYDDAGQFGAIATTIGRHDALGAQTGTISVDLTTQIVTVVEQPADLTLSGTAVYD
ncbi:MAG: hypothetical protein KC464_36230, partial [Myxococcales bacterium]|nr:hypothetical protein [Myxococcales bacterium]